MPSADASVLVWIVVALSFASAACLLAGFMTPIVAVAITVGAAGLTLSGVLPSIELTVLGVAIALLGPGAFSLDARMFGRREILLSHSPRSPKS
ncbi:MAG TPA: hypothetical protein VGJ37_13315 [Pyrinomonadaceae bacterium]|jgi:uncharacterized membrane protein YphA (DoxX/SURF4 family)